MTKATKFLVLIYCLFVFTPVGLTSPQMTEEKQSLQPLFNQEHAKELFGNRAPAGVLTALLEKKDITGFIRDITNESLDPIWRSQTMRITRALINESNRFHLDPLFVMALIEHESNFNPTTLGRFGEMGLMQIKPTTAKWIANLYHITLKQDAELFDPVMNIRIGTAYLSYLRDKFGTKADLYISAYNMGPANVRHNLQQNLTPVIYVTKVMTEYLDLYNDLADHDETDLASALPTDFKMDAVYEVAMTAQSL